MTTTLVSGTPAHNLTNVDRQAGQRAAVIARNRNTEQRNQRIADLVQLSDGLEAEQIGILAVAAALKLAVEVLEDDELAPIDKVRIAQAAETLFKIHRLATGQSTSNAAHATVDAGELSDRRAVLLARLQGTTPPDVTA